MAGTRRGQSLGQSPDHRGPMGSGSPPLHRACVWGSARVSGKAPRLRARGAPEGQLGHDLFPLLGMGGLQGGAGGGGHPVLPGGAGHLQHSSPTCRPRGEPDRPLPGPPMRLRPWPLRRALLQVTRGWDRGFQVPRQPELTSAPCPRCSATRIDALRPGSTLDLTSRTWPPAHRPRGMGPEAASCDQAGKTEPLEPGGFHALTASLGLKQ